MENLDSLPNSVFIYGVSYKLEYKVMDSQGEAYLDEQIIYLNPKYPREFLKATLLHELMHVALDQKYMYNVKAVPHIDDADLREDIVVDACANMLYDVLKENPQIVRWCFGG